jgi:hypothetical protein
MPRLSCVIVACAPGCDPKWAACPVSARMTGLLGAKKRRRKPDSPAFWAEDVLAERTRVSATARGAIRRIKFLLRPRYLKVRARERMERQP